MREPAAPAGSILALPPGAAHSESESLSESILSMSEDRERRWTDDGGYFVSAARAGAAVDCETPPVGTL